VSSATVVILALPGSKREVALYVSVRAPANTTFRIVPVVETPRDVIVVVPVIVTVFPAPYTPITVVAADAIFAASSPSVALANSDRLVSFSVAVIAEPLTFLYVIFVIDINSLLFD
jgi:hypothetical protein